MKQKPLHIAMQPYLDGKVILIDKPYDWTSFDAVKKVRIVTGVSKVGHAGTLDPLATGLLIICTGSFTKQISMYTNMPKEYTGTMILGASTPTYDLESEPQNIVDISNVPTEKIYQTTKIFSGEIMQVPPVFSAIKKAGKPAYLLARKGENVQLDPRKINIYSFEITKINLPEVSFKVVCSTGTYIRSLVNDFGTELKVGAYLTALRRTKIGTFSIEDALTPEFFEDEITTLKTGLKRQPNT